MNILYCKCGAIVADIDIELSNRTNELGEPYYEIICDCPQCKKPLNCSDWGEHENDIQGAKEIIANYYGLTISIDTE